MRGRLLQLDEDIDHEMADTDDDDANDRQTSFEIDRIVPKLNGVQ